MSDTKTILVVDDEPDVRDALCVFLSRRGFDARGAASGEELRTLYEAGPTPALVILDVNLPDEDGYALTRWLREVADPAVGILMLTGEIDTVDRVLGLDLGADDYVTKPFDLQEVLARIKAILRRTGAPREEPSTGPTGEELPVGPHKLRIATRELVAADGGIIELSAMEFDMLAVFARHPNNVLSRERLLDLAHHRRWDPYDRSIDVRINRLRRKIEGDPSTPALLKTVRGAGYMLVSKG